MSRGRLFTAASLRPTASRSGSSEPGVPAGLAMGPVSRHVRRFGVSASSARPLQPALAPSGVLERFLPRGAPATEKVPGWCCCRFAARRLEVRRFLSCGEPRSLRLSSRCTSRQQSQTAKSLHRRHPVAQRRDTLSLLRRPSSGTVPAMAATGHRRGTAFHPPIRRRQDGRNTGRRTRGTRGCPLAPNQGSQQESDPLTPQKQAFQERL